jgi:hypothetical protein
MDKDNKFINLENLGYFWEYIKAHFTTKREYDELKKQVEELDSKLRKIIS